MALDEVPEEGGLGLALMVSLDSEARSTGAFRISLAGDEAPNAVIPLSRILYPTPPQLSNLAVVIVCSSEVMQPQQNSTASAWKDLADLLKERAALVRDSQDEIVDPSQLIAHLLDPASKKANIGASIRWAIAASTTQSLQLELQMLPAPARLLNKQNLKQDNAVSVLLAVFPINTDMFDGDDVAGPVPIFFVADRYAALASLAADHSGLLEDIRAINEKFLMMEHLTLPEALTYMLGRHRAAKGAPAFPAGAAGPRNKRPRVQLDASTASSAGNFLSLTSRIIALQS